MRKPREVLGRRLTAPADHFFLFGPRGTGKTTWLRQTQPRALFIDLLDDAVRRELLAYPERLAGRLAAAGRPRTVVVDEIQKVPHLLNTVHRLIEQRRGWRFILTGSSARKLRRGGVNLLGGRAVLRQMHPFLAAEQGAGFALDRAVRDGMMPLILAARCPADQARAYVGLYLREEIEAERLVRSIEPFARFMEAITFSHAAVLNLNNIARECETTRRSVEGYLGILEDLLLAFRLPVFVRRAARATSVHPKFYLADAGVFRALRPSGPLDQPQEVEGQALEGLVAQHLRAWIDYRQKKNALSFWRTRSGNEVDFVVYGADGLWAIEVKNRARVHPADLRGLRAFLDDYPEAGAILLYRGRERFVERGILCLPCEAFLRRLDPARSIRDAQRADE